MNIRTLRQSMASSSTRVAGVLIFLASGASAVLAQGTELDLIDMFGDQAVPKPTPDLIDKFGDQTVPTDSTPQKKAALEFLPRPSPKEQSILDALNQPMEVALRDNDLLSALDYIKELHSIEIWVDSDRINAGEINVTLEAREISLRSCLNLLLVPRDLAYLVEDDVLKVTTREVAESTFITRTYPVEDLFSTPEEADELTQVLECGLALPLGNGARRSLKISLKSRVIVVRQTHQTHDRLLQLLRDLRNANGDQIASELVLNFGYKRDRRGIKQSDLPVVFYNEKYVDLEQLAPVLEKETRNLAAVHGAEALKDIVVIIRADSDLPTMMVQRLIKTCQDAGYCKFTLRAIADEQ